MPSASNTTVVTIPGIAPSRAQGPSSATKQANRHRCPRSDPPTLVSGRRHTETMPSSGAAQTSDSGPARTAPSRLPTPGARASAPAEQRTAGARALASGRGDVVEARGDGPPTDTTAASSSSTISRRSISPPATCIPSVGGTSPCASTTSPSPLARAGAPAAGRPAGAASGMVRTMSRGHRSTACYSPIVRRQAEASGPSSSP